MTIALCVLLIVFFTCGAVACFQEGSLWGFFYGNQCVHVVCSLIAALTEAAQE